MIVTVPEGGGVSAPDVPSIEAQLADASRSWTDDLAAELAEHNGEERGIDLLRRYGDAFPAAYREDVDPRSAVGDVQRMESLIAGSAGTDLQSVVTRPVDAPRGFVRMRLFRIGEPMALSDVVPLLEHLGVRVVDERPYEVHPSDAPPLWIYDIGLSSSDLDGLDADAARADFCEAFARLWRGEAESDGFNRLVLRAGLDEPQGRGPARVREVPAPDRFDVQPDLHRGHPRGERPHRSDAAAAVRGSLRPRPHRGPHRRGGRARHEHHRGVARRGEPR